ncbi:FGGY-family carbohydrate kinase [Kocuria sp.]|uniref:FGGY-family carbohydrate kinase n=1 Tax=Kocuria sp. TaxID=1871328 RepID=UPI0026DC5FCF|nr:FGGY-family carbohydrate kinase [Kocuria sp.]MDO4919363.1 FGGY-family carbohydrate kinase [Kocuria sp.]
MTQAYIGMDIGTGSTKAVLCSTEGQILHSATRGHEMLIPRPGWAEFDPQGVWWEEICSLGRELMAHAEGTEILGMCVSGMGPCVVLTDDRLEPVRPAILYGIDMRAHREILEQTRRYGEETILADCGTALSSQAVGPKIEWVRNHEPEVFARATRVFGVNSYIAAKLTGAYVQDHHSASQSDPLYSMPRGASEGDTADGDADRAGHWDAARWQDICGPLAQPELVWPHEVVGTVHEAAAEATGIPRGTPVSAGSVDAWVEALSAGVRAPGELMMMYGSTMFLTHTVSEVSAHPQLWSTNGIFPGTLTLAAGMATSGSLLGWWQKQLGDLSFPELDALAREVPPGADGLLSLPYYAGERTPIFDPRARGALVGLTLSHGRGHMIRAQYEGIGFAVRQVLALLESQTEPVTRIVAVGGGAQSPVWTQAVSDITGREQEVPEQTIGASYGDALLAAIGTGHEDPGTSWARTADVVRPREEHRELYNRLFHDYEALYPALKDVMHDLADVQGQS